MSTIRPQSSGIGKSHHHSHSRTARPGFIGDSKNAGVEKVKMYFLEAFLTIHVAILLADLFLEISQRNDKTRMSPLLLISVHVTSAVLKSTGCSFDWNPDS